MPLTGTTQKSSLANIETDPLRNFKFHVHIAFKGAGGRGRAGFMSVSGLSITTDVIVYRQGEMNTTTQKMAGQSDFAPITLSRGLICGDTNFFNWVQQLFKVTRGGDGSNNGDTDYRAIVDVFIIDHPVTSEKVTYKAGWRIWNAWVTSMAFGDLDAGANGVELQQMTLAHEGFDFKIAKNFGPREAVSF